MVLYGDHLRIQMKGFTINHFTFFFTFHLFAFTSFYKSPFFLPLLFKTKTNEQSNNKNRKGRHDC
jgi:uncharacterized membrane protein